MIKANTDDMGPLSLDSFRKSNFSTSWKFGGQENVSDLESDSPEVCITQSFSLSLMVMLFLDRT